MKGKVVPEQIFALLGDEAMASKLEFAQLANANTELLDRYRTRDWRGARECLAVCRRLAGHFHLQGFYDLYATRLDEYETTSPPADWDGVYIAQDKAFSLVKQVRRLTYEAGDTLFREGDLGGSAFFIVSGRIEVCAEGTQLAILSAGDLLGEMSFLERTARSAAARALEPTVVVEIESDTLLQTLGGADSDAAAFICGLVAKLRATNRRLIQADRKAAAGLAPDFSHFDQGI